MASPAFTRGLRKGLRTVVQVAAGGALTALVTAISGGLPPGTQALVMGAWIAFVAFAQNYAETAGKIPVLLPTTGIITPVAATLGSAEAIVDAGVDAGGEVVGTVTDIAGEVIGGITGSVPDDKEAGRARLELLAGVALLLGACGGGDNDTLFTGFSGVVIFVIVVLVAVHYIRKRK